MIWVLVLIAVLLGALIWQVADDGRLTRRALDVQTNRIVEQLRSIENELGQATQPQSLRERAMAIVEDEQFRADREALAEVNKRDG